MAEPRAPAMPAAARRLVLALTVILATPALAQRAALPTGFGPLTLGMPWSEVESAGTVTELTRPTGEWEHQVYDCGYRSARFPVEDGRVLITAQDGVVTELSYATPIKPGSNVMQVAQLVMKNYGQPRQATLRDALGAITIDQSKANYAVLEYDTPQETRFAISGDPLWEYRITIVDRNARRLENRTIRCARELEKESAAQGPAKKSP